MKKVFALDEYEVDDLIEYLSLLASEVTLETQYGKETYKAVGQLDEWIKQLKESRK